MKIFRINNAIHGFISNPLASEHTKACYNIIKKFLNDQNNGNEELK